MIKHITIISLIFLALLSCSRKTKNIKDYYPEVATISATTLPDGRVEVTGQVISPGSTGLTYYGFSLDSLPLQTIETHQLISDSIYEGIFTAIYPPLDSRKTYHLCAWATNGIGYTKANEIEFKTSGFDTSIIPCHYPVNTIYSQYLGKLENVSYVFAIDSSMPWEVKCFSNLHNIDIKFNLEPISGIFRSTDQNRGTDSTVEMTIDGLGVYYNTKVYVRSLSDKKIEITICNARVSNDDRFSAKFDAMKL